MPELPEVEILRRGLSKYVVGLTIAEVIVLTGKILNGGVEKVIGGKIVSIRRFGKMLSIDLTNKMSIAVHVKMTGRLIYRGKKLPKRMKVEEDLKDLPSKHTHLIFTFKNKDRLYYNDVRKFGWIKIIETQDVENLPFVAKLGPEPGREINAKGFYKLHSKYSRPIKTLLMDQQRISGVGNIYANEALFCAGILPFRKSNTIDSKLSRKLYKCILKVFEDGLKFGGSSTDSYRNVLGQKGSYQQHYLIYDREGEKCQRSGCKSKVLKTKLGGRGIYYCSKCQK